MYKKLDIEKKTQGKLTKKIWLYLDMDEKKKIPTREKIYKDKMCQKYYL